MFTVSLNEAITLLNQKKGGRTVLKELGAHPKSGSDVQVLSGRYGPYVTDGTANASLPKDMEPGDLSMDEAVSMLADAAKRKKSGRRKSGAKK
jgi:DNA topoisomerase-1